MGEYIVRLLIRVSAESPHDAVNQYIENVNKFGLRSWVYVVENAQTKDLYQVTGQGEVTQVDPSKFVASQ